MSIACTLEDVADRDIAVLKIKGDLQWDDRADFQNAVRDLLATDRAKLVIDLSKITRMSSVYIGTIIDFGTRARDAGRSLSVILVKRVAEVVEKAGLQKVVSVIPVDS